MKNWLLILLLFVGLTQQLHAQWITQPTGLPASGNVWGSILSIKAVDANIVWATTWTKNTDTYNIIRTTNGGQTWSIIPASSILPTGSYYGLGNITAIDGNRAWFIAFSNTPISTRIYNTTDGGQNWTYQSTAFSAGSRAEIIHFFNINDGIAFGGANGGIMDVYQTSNRGNTWVKVPQANLPAAYPFGDEIAPTDFTALGNTIWVATSSYRIFKSTDKGVTWSATTTPASGIGSQIFMNDIAFTNANNGLATYQGTLYRTTNGGTTWNLVNHTGPLHRMRIAAIPGTPGAYISVGDYFVNWHATSPTSDKGASISMDNGNTWVMLDSTYSHGPVEFIDKTTGWTGGDDVMHKLSGNILGTKESLPSFSGFQIAPNPGSSYFTITNPEAKPFRLEVYDLLGNRVMHAKESYLGKGILNLSGQNKGVYLLHILSGEKRFTEKIVLQ